ncbi:hypothetical protein CC2G_004352 [Coprinopsis cinerea AmutBmut pab1-1]|nr:hypothetical protein CC2G_004352 [Coprinopsis cinerea AmutBmut pab1-1]
MLKGIQISTPNDAFNPSNINAVAELFTTSLNWVHRLFERMPSHDPQNRPAKRVKLTHQFHDLAAPSFSYSSPDVSFQKQPPVTQDLFPTLTDPSSDANCHRLQSSRSFWASSLLALQPPSIDASGAWSATTYDIEMEIPSVSPCNGITFPHDMVEGLSRSFSNMSISPTGSWIGDQDVSMDLASDTFATSASTMPISFQESSSTPRIAVDASLLLNIADRLALLASIVTSLIVPPDGSSM